MSDPQLREIIRSLRRAHRLLVEHGGAMASNARREIEQTGYMLTGDPNWWETGRKIVLTGREP